MNREANKIRRIRWWNKHKNEPNFYNRYRAQKLKNNRRKRVRNIEEALNAHNNKCKMCGIDDKRVLVWHHIDGKDTRLSIRSLATNSVAFWKEIKKCILICANCHIIIHRNEDNKENI